jgi:predicted transcriptional regulator
MTVTTENLVFSSKSLQPLPCNIEAEISVLGGILLDDNSIQIVRQILEPSDFFVEHHQLIYESCLKLYEKNNKVNLITLADYLDAKKHLKEIGGRSRLADLLDSTVSACNIDHLAKLIRTKSRRRKLISLGYKIVDRGYDDESNLDVRDFIEEQIIGVVSEKKSDVDRLVIEQKYFSLIKEIEEIEENTHLPGLKHMLMSSLASKYQIRNLTELEHIYQKSLLDKEDTPMMTYEQLKEMASSEVRNFLMYGLIPSGTGILLHALGGVGKTKFAYFLSCLLAKGKSWGDFTTTKKCRILIIQTDESPSDLKQAFDTLGYPEGAEFRFKTNWCVDNFPKLKREMEEWKPDIVLVDSITTINRSSIFSENDVAYARPVLQMIRYGNQNNITFLFIHHSNAAGDKSRGTTALFNSVSEVWQLRLDPKYTDPSYKILKIQKSRSRSSNIEYKLQVDYETLQVVCLGENLENISSDDLNKRDKILNFLRGNRNKAYETEEISQTLSISSSHTRKCLTQLKLEGLISWRELRKVGKGSKFCYFISGDDSDTPETIDTLINAPEANDERIYERKPNPDTEGDTGVNAYRLSKNDNLSEDFQEKNEYLDERKALTPESAVVTGKSNAYPNAYANAHPNAHAIIDPEKVGEEFTLSAIPDNKGNADNKGVVSAKDKNVTEISVQGVSGIWIFKYWIEIKNRREILLGQFISPSGEERPREELPKSVIRDVNALDNYTFAKVSMMESRVNQESGNGGH